MKVTSESFDLIVKYILRLCSIWHDFGVVLPVVLYIISSPFYMNCRVKKRTLSTQWIRQYTRLFYVKIINAIIDIYSLSHTYIATLLLRMEYIHTRGNGGCGLLYSSRAFQVHNRVSGVYYTKDDLRKASISSYVALEIWIEALGQDHL